jgi:uncharacterized protein YfkK (UPF0435 family)
VFFIVTVVVVFVVILLMHFQGPSSDLFGLCECLSCLCGCPLRFIKSNHPEEGLISEIEHVRVKLNHINFRVIKPYTVRSLDTTSTERLQELLIIITLAGKVIETLIILNPESNIPGLIILPPVVGDIKSIGLVGSSH